MKFLNIKKYLDLRKYISLNIASVAGYFMYINMYKMETAEPLPPVDYGEGLVYIKPYADEEFVILFALFLLVFLSLIEIVLKILISFIRKKYFNKETDEAPKGRKTKLFRFFEILYTVLFAIGLLPFIFLWAVLIYATLVG